MHRILVCLGLVCLLSGGVCAGDAVSPQEPGLKSVATARLLQAVVPGLGKVYARNPWYGLLDFAVVGVSGYACVSVVNRYGGFSPVTADNGTTDISAVFFAAVALAYHGYHVWAVREDVLAHNYRILFYQRPETFLKLGANNGGATLQAGVCF